VLLWPPRPLTANLRTRNLLLPGRLRPSSLPSGARTCTAPSPTPLCTRLPCAQLRKQGARYLCASSALPSLIGSLSRMCSPRPATPRAPCGLSTSNSTTASVWYLLHPMDAPDGSLCFCLLRSTPQLSLLMAAMTLLALDLPCRCMLSTTGSTLFEAQITLRLFRLSSLNLTIHRAICPWMRPAPSLCGVSAIVCRSLSSRTSAAHLAPSPFGLGTAGRLNSPFILCWCEGALILCPLPRGS
jgi:hypothetical protein